MLLVYYIQVLICVFYNVLRFINEADCMYCTKYEPSHHVKIFNFTYKYKHLTVHLL